MVSSSSRETLSDVELDVLAEKVAKVFYAQFVTGVADNHFAEWSSDGFSSGMDPEYLRIVAFFRSLSTEQAQQLRPMIRRVVADNFISMLGLFTGEVDIGLPGHFGITYNGHDIGIYLREQFLMLDEKAIDKPKA